MKAPRDLARRDPWAQSVARALTPPSLSPALAVERDLSDPSVWQESIWRSQRRREAEERQLNFGPMTGKRVAVPLAMLAAGLVARDAIVSGDGLDVAAAGASRAAAADPDHHVATHRAAHVKAASVAGRKASPGPTEPAVAKKKEPTAASIAAARPKPPPDPMADGELTKGERGAAVSAAQQKLGVSPDGVYGASTLHAVTAFQKRHGLTPDGRIGPVTQRALAHPGSAPEKAPSKKHAGVRAARSAVHSHAGGVKGLQSALKVQADGVFGHETSHAVRVFQRAHGLKADGVVGPATWEALGVRDPGKVLKQHRKRAHRASHGERAHHSAPTSHGTGIADLQRALGVTADGVFGRQTARAVRAFQRSHGLTADGVVGPATWSALGVKGAHRVLHQRHASSSHGHSNSGGGSSSGSSSVVQRAIAAANQIATLPYRYGGGHGSFEDSGYDCSGSVSYVLHGAGLLSSPLDSSAFMSYGAPGPGKHITIYANPGHVFMTIDGRRFDTGYGGEGNRWASGSRPTGGFTVRHPPGL